MTTPGKNYPGQRGFPTPDSLPETSVCRTFRVPSGSEYLALLMGAVDILSQEWAWYQWGALTPSEAASAWNQVINEVYLEGTLLPCPGDEATVDTPYWDDDTDVADEQPEATQPWFGYVTDALNPGELNFIEDITIWLITGFILASSGGAGIVPAIFFRTNAKAFVLQHRNDNLGDVIRYFVDGSLAAVYTDDGSGNITDVPVTANPENATHDLYVTIEKAP